jgi:predicted metal-binding protein
MRRLVFCSTCKFSPESKTGPDGRTGGELLHAAMQAVLQRLGRTDVETVTQACMWNCDKPCSVVIQDDERFSYVTGRNVPSEEQAEAILAWFDAYGESDDGTVPFRQWPQMMRGHFIARLPPAEKRDEA